MVFVRALILPLLAVLLPLVAFAANPPRSAPTRPATDSGGTYQGAIVLDAATGAVLFENRADHVGPPASVTKLMTYLVVHDSIRRGDLTLTTPIRITAEAASMGGSQVFLAEKEVFPVEELLYALMIASANDAAAALAIHVAGSRPAFVERMNARALELGMNATHFRTPHGLPPVGRRIADGDLTSPRDLAKLSLHLVAETDVLKYASVEHREFRPGPRRIAMDSHNNLLGKYAGVDGLKTGYTAAAGYCISATAQRNGRRLIVVIMGAFGPNGQRDLGRARDLTAVGLFERGFAALPPASPPFVGSQPTASGRDPAISPMTPAPAAGSPAATVEREGPMQISVPPLRRK